MNNKKGCATPESRRYGVNASGDMSVHLVNVNGTEPNLRKERRDTVGGMDRGRGVYVLVHKDELKRRKWTGGLVSGVKIGKWASDFLVFRSFPFWTWRVQHR